MGNHFTLADTGQSQRVEFLIIDAPAAGVDSKDSPVLLQSVLANKDISFAGLPITQAVRHFSEPPAVAGGRGVKSAQYEI
jgi:hypothetical protein